METKYMDTKYVWYSDTRDHYVVYFIPGNPGLLHYYSPFLEKLRALLEQPCSSARFFISGCSLQGFDLSPYCPARKFGLEDQVVDQETCLRKYFSQILSKYPSRNPPKVILMGHSVGTWIILELIRRHRKIRPHNFDIIGGILLFPTIIGRQLASVS